MTTTPHHPQIELRGVRVHNLQNVDLDIPLGRLIVVTGLSGSGKSSLAFDTLYAEGQRRYVESFSTCSRRFLERFEKPDADRIEPIPPAVAVRQKSAERSRRATVGTATEIYDHLRLLFARAGAIECPGCQRLVERHTPASTQTALAGLEPGTRFIICFPAGGVSAGSRQDSSAGTPSQGGTDAAGGAAALVADLAAAGFNRLIAGGRTLAPAEAAPHIAPGEVPLAVVDRLTAGTGSPERLADSLELAFRHGGGSCVVLVQQAVENSGPEKTAATPRFADRRITVDAVEYVSLSFHARLICSGCGSEFAEPEPALFNFNSALGACPKCRGTGETAGDDAAGRPAHVCPDCGGTRLQPQALVVRFRGQSIADLNRLNAADLRRFLAGGSADAPVESRALADQIRAQIVPRLDYLIDVGLGYLTLDRPVRTLSRGEAQRVRLTAAFGSRFVNMLYVLDEPTAGLHPRDTQTLLAAIGRLRDAGNSVVVVEHDAAIIGQADQVIDIGPGAGRDGGRIVFQGSPRELAARPDSATANFLSGRARIAGPQSPVRREPTGWLRLEGVEHHNLHDLAVDLPLGVLCVVTGVSGSGKSSLVEETLYPAIAAGLRGRAAAGTLPPAADARPAAKRPGAPFVAGRCSSLTGIDQIDAALLIDQAPIGRSGRANPAGFVNLFGEIRTLFAGTAEAKVRNFSPRHFSFNSAAGGRCETCRGAGSIAVDMQFLPDVVTTCPDCHGSRYRREILDVRYRGQSIAEVLALTVSDAFSFFRGRTRLQRRLKVLKDVGLGYLTLGQPADTLSGGESQRLKLAAFLSRAARARTLFLIDEPTTGLHPADVSRLVDCLGQIIAGGHSLVVIEHNLDFIRHADYVIDLGPEAGAAGGRIVATGTPEDIARAGASITGRYLAREDHSVG